VTTVGPAIPSILAALTLSGGCGDGAADARDAGADATGPGGDDPDFARAPALVEIVSRGDPEGGAFDTAFHAELRDAPAPTLLVESLREGACRLLESAPPSCDPPCAATALCTATDVCSPYPPARSAGPISITSGDDAFALTAAEGIYSHYEGDAPLVAGADVRAVAEGDERPGFAVHAPWPEPLVAELGDRPQAGEPFTLTWIPADPAARFVVMLRTDLGHGAWPPVRIECDAPDEAGQLTIAAAMVDAFVDPAAWSCGDCFGSWIGRVRRVAEPGGVELWLERRIDVYVGPF
jgi:hypothetical protein